MMVVQMVICVSGDACTHQLNVLAREDANEAERAIAQAVEGYIALVMEQIASENGAAVEYVGPQHEEGETTP